MAIAFWCLLVALLMPPMFAAIAKATAEGRYNNRSPREFLEKQSGVSRRADWAQRNSFEILPAFISGVFAAIAAGTDEQWLARLSVAFIVTRVAYGICYLKDWALARTLCWSAGLVCCLWLLVNAALAVGG
ncbi:MAPEG family protein [Microbulbifer sp. Q7]|uniref:MAPEG family protein n=1 Tax=Microbulbifer sp. Q7 TaxID=1785091 RepID=UPI00082B2D44|nr:MAPEG family protein [Microbulbifer sp. Q7]